MTQPPTPLPRRHAEPDYMAECVRIDTAFAAWLLARQQKGQTVDARDPAVLRSCWRTAWVEGVIRAHQLDDDADDLVRATQNAVLQ